jgi:hypothetical protein
MCLPSIRLLSLSVLLVVTLVFTSTLVAQQPKLLAPHKPIPPRVEKPIPGLTPAMPRSMVGGLWMTDATFKSSIYLRNVVQTSSVTVTPILHLSNGAQYTLPDVTVRPAAVTIISINDELQKKGISPWAALSGYVELQYLWPWDPFCATVRNVDTAHSLIFTYPLRPALPLPLLHILHPKPPNSAHTIEGMWWKQEKDVVGFVSVANLSAEPADATVEVTNSQAMPISRHKFNVSPHGMKFVKLPELQTDEGTQGGIRVTSSSIADKLIISGGLEDPRVGYSAQIPFSMDLVEASPAPVSVAELGLMAGAADPMMLFPAGTTFTPYSVLRNVSDSPLSVTPTVWWMQGAAPHSARLLPISLLPYEGRNLDVMSLLAQAGLVSSTKTFNGSFNLVFDGNVRPGALLLGSGSVDQTNTYVFEVVARGVTESASKSLQYWSTGNGDDTMVTLWNPADEAQDFIFKLFFETPGGSGGHYALPLHLGPRATRSLNVSEIIQNQLPDVEGNLVPASVHEGSIQIQGSQAQNEHILLAVDSGIYNVRKATCGNNCMECDGYVSSTVVVAPFSVTVQGTLGLTLLGTWNTTGGQYGIGKSWSSSKTAVATVANISGLVTGVSVGSAIISGISDFQPEGIGYVCVGPQGCPTTIFSGSSSGSVTPTVSFSNIPNVAVGQTATTSASVAPSGNTVPISLSITGPAAIISPTGTFTQSTSVIVKGLSVGTATLTATVSNSDGSKPTVGSTSFPVVPVITGGHTVWWFNGQNPNSSSWPTQVTLSSSAGGSWAVISGSSYVRLSSTSGSSITVSGTGAFSQGANDVRITVTVNGITSSAFAMTSNGPKQLSNPTSLSYACTGTGETGWHYDKTYRVLDNFNNITKGLPVSEGVGAPVSDRGDHLTFPAVTPTGGTTDAITGNFTDGIFVCATGNVNPMPQNYTNGSGTSLVDHSSQAWCAGSSTSSSTCTGASVQNDTIKRYLDHGAVTIP